MRPSDRILYSEEEIRNRAKEIGKEISEDCRGHEIVLIGILRGAVMWMTDVMKEIDGDVEIDFMVCSSYGNEFSSSGNVRIEKDTKVDIKGKAVIIIEDIVDSGRTLKKLKEHLMLREPESIELCALLDKPSGRKVEIDVKYKGFVLKDDSFIVGYGLDAAQKYRQLPYITFMES